jgi:DNA-binding NarL/FixJ family response regulator
MESRVFPTLNPEFRCDDSRMRLSAVIVDDDPAFLALASRILVDRGIDVVGTAADAAQAVTAVHESQPDAVLVDIGLPDRDGIDLAYELLELPWRPRIVLTSSDSDAFAAIEVRDGFGRPPFIPKEELAGDALLRAMTTR